MRNEQLLKRHDTPISFHQLPTFRLVQTYIAIADFSINFISNFLIKYTLYIISSVAYTSTWKKVRLWLRNTANCFIIRTISRKRFSPQRCY